MHSGLSAAFGHELGPNGVSIPNDSPLKDTWLYLRIEALSGKMDLYWWLALSRVSGIGPMTYSKLLQRFGAPGEVFKASYAELLNVEMVGRQTAQAVKAFRDDGWVERELDRVGRLRIRIVTIQDKGQYPPPLMKIPDPPPYLYVKGALRSEDHWAVAVVGSRSASTYGLKVTNRLARELVREGVTVVSGMARGVDSEAHLGALAGGGRTIAVLGSGLNVIYPPENRELYERIAERGAVVSEYPLDAEPDAIHFPARNRIISGMSMGVVIVEAAPKSGSLITAHLALEQGREVFAVPGSVDSVRSRGAHQLIRQGAHLVESAEDILEELRGLVKAWGGIMPGRRTVHTGSREALTPNEENILALLDEEPLHIDELIERGGLGPSPTTAVLLHLELKGCVRQLPGKRFLRVERQYNE
jgi:DNA processing protein